MGEQEHHRFGAPGTITDLFIGRGDHALLFDETAARDR